MEKEITISVLFSSKSAARYTYEVHGAPCGHTAKDLPDLQGKVAAELERQFGGCEDYMEDAERLGGVVP